jgi:tetratricopeptide (TPR) repeat protein
LKILDGALSRLDPAAREQIGNAQFLRGDALARLNRYPEAERAFREEIRLFPKTTEAYARLAVLYAVEHRRLDVRGQVAASGARDLVTGESLMASVILRSAATKDLPGQS